MARLLSVAALLAFLAACGDDFAAAQKAHTIDAYEAYLKDHPTGRHTLDATAVLETLYLEEARKNGTLEAYDRYLTRFPKGDLHARALEERETFLYEWALSAGTVEGWDRFLGEYPSTSRERKAEAKKLREVATYVQKLQWSPLKMAQINLARDPSGPKNGWELTSEVTNAGDRTVKDLVFTVDLLGPAGTSIAKDDWPLVASVWHLPLPEERKVPMKPGETRTWVWTSEDPAPGKWKQEATIRPTRIAFVE
ncbi:MAG: hypothetical protein H6736_16560 [Alphaproteobacteria bacterium]|nr:hypothetical protein [Alphaproteobacteria bacterium]